MIHMPSGLFRKVLHRTGESPWEIVGRWEIAPVPMYTDDDDGMLKANRKFNPFFLLYAVLLQMLRSSKSTAWIPS
jgi:hypothetical protein